MEDNKNVKPNRIPSWQLAEPSTGPDDQPQDSPGSSPQTPSNSRGTLIKQAATFLLDENVRHAPLEQKRTFLQSKGLSIDEIDRLLLQAPVSERPLNATSEIKDHIPEVLYRV